MIQMAEDFSFETMLSQKTVDQHFLKVERKKQICQLRHV